MGSPSADGVQRLLANLVGYPMRKSVLLFAPTTLALALAALAGCETDSPGGSPGFQFDSGVADWTPPPTTTTDGGATPDAAPDAPVVPSVSVTVLGYAGPKAGVRIVFHDASGAVLETKLTGNDGKATRTGETPAMVSALIAMGSYERRIVTWTGVEDGDDLQLLAGEEEDAMIGMYNVTLANAPDVSIFTVANACDRNESYGTATELPLYRSCARAQNAVLATGRPFQGAPTAFAYKKGNPIVTDGGTGAITLDDWKSPAAFTLNVTNRPAEGWFDASLLEIADGSPFENHWSNWDDNGAVTYSIAPGFADAYQASAMFEGQAGAERRIAKRVAAGSSNVTLDYATILPALESADLDTTNPRRPVITWTPTAPLTATDGGVIHFTFYSQEVMRSWTLVVPGNVTTVTAPAMPTEAEDFLPHAEDAGVSSSFAPPRLMFVESDAIPSYASFRKQQGLLLDRSNRLPVLPADGTLRTTSWSDIPR